MEEVLQGQVTRSAADVYEDFFIPALFGQWAERVADLACLATGERVLDVACGTGVLAREAARRIGPRGAVVGLDCNPLMLEVARRKAPEIDWRLGGAEALPFEDADFDVVFSQFGLMFFNDRSAALREMWRVMRPGGRLAVAVCGAIEDSPGYFDLVALLERLFGRRVADELRAPFALGKMSAFSSLITEAGIPDAEIWSPSGNARFASIREWMHTDVKGWTLGDMIDEEQYQRLADAAERELAQYVRREGMVQFAFPAHIALARKH